MHKNDFKKEARLRKSTDFKRLSKTGKKISNRFFIIIYGKGISDQARLGLTVSKRVGKAVVRNRIKRAIREFFRTYDNRQWLTLDINVIAKQDAAFLSVKEVIASLQPIFNRIANKHA